MTTLDIHIIAETRERCLEIAEDLIDRLYGPPLTIAYNDEGESAIGQWDNHTIVFTDGIVAP